MAVIKTIDVLEKEIVSTTNLLRDARKSNEKADIESQLGALQVLLLEVKSRSESERKTLSEEISLAETEVKTIVDKFNDLEKTTVMIGVRAELAAFRKSMTPPKSEEDEKGVSPWLVNLGNGIKTGAGATWIGAKYVGEKVKVNAVYAWKNFIVKPFSAIMGYFGVKNIQMPPVALHARSLFLRFVGGFMPKATREAMQKNLDEEFAFHAITGQVKALVADLNAVRASKTPPEKPITFDFNNQLTQFRLLTAEERKGIPRKVMAAVKEGKTEITLETLFDGSKPAQTAGTERTTAAIASAEAITAKDLPTETADFGQLQSGIKIKGQLLKMKSSPAVVSYSGKRWVMQHKDSLKASLSTFAINKANWDGTKLNITVTGTPNALASTSTFLFSRIPFLGVEQAKPQTASGKILKDQMVQFIEHMRSGSTDYVLRKANGDETDAVLHLA